MAYSPYQHPGRLQYAGSSNDWAETYRDLLGQADDAVQQTCYDLIAQQQAYQDSLRRAQEQEKWERYKRELERITPAAEAFEYGMRDAMTYGTGYTKFQGGIDWAAKPYSSVIPPSTNDLQAKVDEWLSGTYEAVVT